MADKKVSELTPLVNVSGDDLLLVVNDPNGTPSSRKVTVGNLFGNVASNVAFTGSSVTITGDLVLGSVNINDQIADRMQVANTIAAINDALSDPEESPLTASINDRMQVANTQALVLNERANTNVLVNDRMQVANTRTLILNERANSDFKLAVAVAAAEADFANTLANLSDASVSNTFVANTLYANGAVSTGTLQIRTKSADVPISNAALLGVASGLVFYSNTYLYVSTDSNTIKRLHFESDFTSVENRLIDLGELP